MSTLTRREFIRRSLILSAGASLIVSCEDNNMTPTSSQDTALANYIGLAEGRIHFAGEHASNDRGWMQGALVSGLRAATEINNSN